MLSDQTDMNLCSVGCPDGSNPLDVTRCAKKVCPDGYTCNTDDVSYGVCCPGKITSWIKTEKNCRIIKGA